MDKNPGGGHIIKEKCKKYTLGKKIHMHIVVVLMRMSPQALSLVDDLFGNG